MAGGKLLARRGMRRLRRASLIATIAIVLGCAGLRAQGTPQGTAPQNPTTQNAGPQKATPQNPAATSAERDVTLRTLPKNFLYDQKDIWLFPVQLAKGRDWLPTLAVTGATAALIAVDPHDTPYFRRTTQFGRFNEAFSGSITASEIAFVPPAFLWPGIFAMIRTLRRPHSWPGKPTPTAPSLMWR